MIQIHYCEECNALKEVDFTPPPGFDGCEAVVYECEKCGWLNAVNYKVEE